VSLRAQSNNHFRDFHKCCYFYSSIFWQVFTRIYVYDRGFQFSLCNC